MKPTLLTLLLTLTLLLSCTAFTPIDQQTVKHQERGTAGPPALGPTGTGPTAGQQTENPQQSKGWFNWLSQRNTSGIDPLWFLAFMALQVFLSHRREMQRLRGKHR